MTNFVVKFSLLIAKNIARAKIKVGYEDNYVHMLDAWLIACD